MCTAADKYQVRGCWWCVCGCGLRESQTPFIQSGRRCPYDHQIHFMVTQYTLSYDDILCIELFVAWVALVILKGNLDQLLLSENWNCWVARRCCKNQLFYMKSKGRFIGKGGRFWSFVTVSIVQLCVWWVRGCLGGGAALAQVNFWDAGTQSIIPRQAPKTAPLLIDIATEVPLAVIRGSPKKET